MFCVQVTNVKSIVEQWRAISSELSPQLLGRLPDTAVMADLIGRFDTRLDDDGDDEAASAVTAKSLCSCVRLLVHLQVIVFHDHICARI